MALIKCPECNKDVSEFAEACPNCGFGIKTHFEVIRFEQEKFVQREIDKQKSLKQQVEDEQKRKEQYQSKLSSVIMPDKPHLGANFYVSFLWSALWIFAGIIFIAPPDGQDTSLLGIIIALFFTIIGIYIVQGCIKIHKQKRDLYKLSKTDFEEYKIRFLLYEEKSSKAEEALRVKIETLEQEKKERLSIPAIPATLACPACNGKNIIRITTVDRMISVGAVGRASGLIDKQYECRICKHKW